MIYFIQENEPQRRRIKIGYTSKDDVTQRLKELQTASPTKLRVLAVMDGDITKEAWVHSLFDHEKVSGEWFEPSARLAGFIRYFTDGSIAVPPKTRAPADDSQRLPLSVEELINGGAFLERNSNGYARLRWMAKDKQGNPIMTEGGSYAKRSRYVPEELVGEVERLIAKSRGSTP